MIRVLLVDDHTLLRAGLVALLEGAGDLQVVGEAADGDRALTVTADLVATGGLPDVVLMDLSMPGTDGVAATAALRARYPGIAVVVLTSFSDRARVRDALQAGAIGYLLKDSEPRDLIAGVRAAARGEAPLDPRIAGALLPGADAAPSGPRLSPREREVLALIGLGLPNRQIARRLGIAERTVKVHLTSVFRQLGVADRTSAALWAREHL